MISGSDLAARALDPSTRVRLASPDLILVGGMPGAGKTTAIAAATADLGDVTVLDPERLHRAVRDRVPSRVPYRAYRALVHTGHTLAVLGHLVLGPAPGRRLVVHDPGTRRRRRRLYLGLARLRGWRVMQVFVDVERTAARSGQLARGRALRPAAFDRHWERWLLLRERLDASGRRIAGDQPYLVDRDRAAAVLRWLCTGGDPQHLDVIGFTAYHRAA